MISCMTFAHGLNALIFQKSTHFESLKTLSSRLCQKLFISNKTEEKLSDLGRI